MTCIVIGPGLVGSFLGAAASAAGVVCGPSRGPRARRAVHAGSAREWDPRLLTPEEARAADLPLLVATRVHQTPWAALPGHARCAQNGLGQRLPVITCFFAVDEDADAVRAVGVRARVVLAPAPRAWDAVLAAWSAFGIAVEVVDDPRPAQWEKTILNATVGPLCLAFGLGMGDVWADAALRRLTMSATAEGVRIAAAAGVHLRPGLMERAQAFFPAVGQHRPSVVADPRELPWVLGALVREAQRTGTPAPALVRIAGMVGQAARPVATARSGG